MAKAPEPTKKEEAPASSNRVQGVARERFFDPECREIAPGTRYSWNLEWGPFPDHILDEIEED